MLVLSQKGLYCPRGGFHVDPSRGVDTAVVTHAHSDHARRGSKLYITAAPGVGVLKQRLGPKIAVKALAYGQPLDLGGVRLSLHPAGHILGSAQVRLEAGGEVWVASGDYKREPDPTCEPFEVVPCDVFVTEATFGTPGYSWPADRDMGLEIHAWWKENAARGVNSVLRAYSLGKAQRVLGVLARLAHRPILCHPAVTPINECYRVEGVPLAATRCLSALRPDEALEGELLVTPSAPDEALAARLGECSTAFASGWTAKGYGSYDRGFPMSDHADWDALVRTIRETGARRVFVQHRNGALVRHLNGLGLRAYPESELVPKDPGQLALF